MNKLILKDAWQDFVDGKINKNPGIRSEVFDSWLRSRQWGIDPYMERATITLSGSALAEELERKREFLSVTYPVIVDIYSAIRGTGSGVWVTNEKGVVIQLIADSDINDLCTKNGFVMGADWSEQKVGNNAVGTALFLKRAVQLVGPEHYRKAVHKGYCSAAPIMGPAGEVLGVLDVTGFGYKSHPHSLGMVVACVGAIQREMQLRSSHQYIMEMIESLPSGIIVVNQAGTINNINRKACEILKSSVDSYLGQNIFKVLNQIDCIQMALQTGKEVEEREYYFEKGKERVHFVVTCRPILNRAGFLDGAVVILREIEAVIRMTGKMAGYKARFAFNDIVGDDLSFKNVVKQAEAAALTSSNILIMGESGTGKEILAQSIHNASDRKYGPFVAINCGAIPRELIGSELFGYEEGAFTGAKKGGNPGKFELANNGTIFLDEIGDMPLDLQLMLLRVIQERVVTRLGGHREIPVNVRLIAATNKNLYRMVSDKLFREDLYYRINVVSFKIPPLRERKKDIILLADHIIKTQTKKAGTSAVTLNSKALAELENYRWPGNVRELENVLERARIFSGSNREIASLSDLIDSIKAANDGLAQKSKPMSSHDHRERDLITEALIKCGSNITKASQELGITRATLYRKLRVYGIKKSADLYQI
jgi:PAS domain S-box-containing protein